MFTHLPITVQQAELDDSGGAHHYSTPTHHRYPSVTMMVSRTKLEKDKQQLKKWRDEQGEKLADYILTESSIIGRESHELNENYLNMIDKNDDFRLISHAHFKNFRSFLNKIDNIHGIELRLFSDKFKLGGTADCIAEYNGVLSVIDYKTKRTPQKGEWLTDYFIQTTAYAKMYEELTSHKVKQLVILVSSEKNTKQEFIKKVDDYVNPFMARLNQFYS